MTESYSARRAINTFTLPDSILDQYSSFNDAATSKSSITARLSRRASTTDRPRRTLIKNRHTDAMPGKPVITPEEFDTLPPSIQYDRSHHQLQPFTNILGRKKYFSHEERLQIAQAAAVEKRQRKPSQKSEAQPQYSNPALPIETPKRRRTLRKSDSVKQRRSSLPLAFDPNAPASDDKAWFESLPDKVRRSQFSKQERDAISHTNERPHTSSGSKPCFMEWDRKKAMSRTNVAPHSPSTSIAMSTFSRETTKSEPALATTRQYLAIQTSPQLPALKSVRSTPEQDLRSTRRAFLLHPLPLPPPVLAPSTALLSPDSESLQQEKQLGHQPIISIDGAVELDPDTSTHSTTHSATKQPKWYDEKLDFGFETLSARKQSTSTSTSSVPPRTLSPSISDGASFETSGPMTPITPVQNIHSFEHSIRKEEHRQTSLRHAETNATNYSHPQSHAQTQQPRTPAAQKPVHLIDGFYADHASMQPYSITIHYGHNDPLNHDPLALQALPVCDDMTGSHGAFAVHDEKSARGMRRVLKAIRGH